MRQPQTIPSFALYGEDTGGDVAGFAHIETIAERSALHAWEIAPHRHADTVQVLLVAEGHVTARIDERTVALDGPCFLVIPQAVVHGFRFAPQTSGYVITLSAEFGARGASAFDTLGPILTQGSNGPLGEDAARRVFWLAGEMLAMPQVWHRPEALFLTMAEALIRSLPASELQADDETPDAARLALFKHLVETHLREQRPVAFYAEALRITPRTLARACRQGLGCSPLEWINRRCALEAQRMLRFTGASTAQIGFELGFADPSYFSRFYLRMTGRRPQAERILAGIL